MIFIFIPRGRLGNAIFRYLAASVLCIKYNGSYVVYGHNQAIIDDRAFLSIANAIINSKPVNLREGSFLVSGFYQHDEIYKLYKDKIIEFIMKNNHYVLTDGIEAGDGMCQQYFMRDIIICPSNININVYDLVLHIRLGDQVQNKNSIPLDKILDLINNLTLLIAPKTVGIVVENPKTIYELDYVRKIQQCLTMKYAGIDIVIESNDVLMDFHIIKNCKTLVCSISTLSWCAALLSSTITKCYMPRLYTKTTAPDHCTCYYPINNTELFEI